MSRILVVEDEPMVAEVVERYLRRDGHAVTLAFDGASAVEQFMRERSDLVILDLMLPQLDGASVCREIRRQSDVPIIMLTARGGERDRIGGLDTGADDYITKPFSPAEVTARVRALLRRAGRGERRLRTLDFGHIRMEGERRAAIVDGSPVPLTAREFDLLYHLASHPSQVFSRERLVVALWGEDFEGDATTVTVHVRRLREKIEADPAKPRHVRTVWGAGYCFEP